MEYKTIKQEFYNLYNKYKEFLNDLDENNSEGVIILNFSNDLLYEYFEHNEDEKFPSELKEFFSYSQNLEMVFEFFKIRIEYLYYCFDKICNRNFKTFDSICPNIYYLQSLYEILDNYYNLNIQNPKKLDELKREIDSTIKKIEKGKPFSVSVVNKMDVKLNDLLIELFPEKNCIIPSTLVHGLYNILVKYNNQDIYNDDLDEIPDLEKFSSTINELLSKVSSEYAVLSFKLDKNNYLFNNISLVKDFLEKFIDVILNGKLDYFQLQNYLNVPLEFVFCFYPTLYFKIIILTKYIVENVNISTAESQAQNIIKISEMESALMWMEQLLSDDEDLKVLIDYVNDLISEYTYCIQNNKIIGKQLKNSSKEFMDDFLNMISLDHQYKSINELTLELYKKICDKYNEYH